MAFGKNYTDEVPPIVVPVLFWTTGLCGFVFGLAILLLHPAVLMGFAFRAPVFLLATHAFTVGFVTPMMLGALFQWLPVVTGRRWERPRRAVGLWVLYVLGAGGILTGFATFHWVWVSLGGSLLVIALFGFAVLSARLLAKVRKWPVPLYFVVSGIGYLLLTVSLGLMMAVNGWRPFLPSWVKLPEHLLVGLGGWFAFTLVGVSYKLLPMFAVARRDPPRGKWVFAAFHAALVLALFGMFWGPLGLFSEGLAVIGFGTYVWDMLELCRTRRSREADPAVWAMFAGVGAAALALMGVIALKGENGQAAMWFFVFNGWLGLSIAAFLQKIVPFAIWVHRFHRHRKGPPLPHLPAILPTSHRWQSLTPYGLGVALATSSLLAHWTFGVEVGLGLEIAGILRLVWGLAGAWARSRPTLP